MMFKLNTIWRLVLSNEFLVVCTKGRYSSSRIGDMTQKYFWGFVDESVKALKKETKDKANG